MINKRQNWGNVILLSSSQEAMRQKSSNKHESALT
jgi:hypothetical protein